MESKTARGAIFGVVACRQGGARFAHLKAIKWSAPLLPSDCATPYFRKSLSWTSCGAVHRIRNRIATQWLHGYEKSYPWGWRGGEIQNSKFKIQNELNQREVSCHFLVVFGKGRIGIIGRIEITGTIGVEGIWREFRECSENRECKEFWAGLVLVGESSE